MGDLDLANPEGVLQRCGEWAYETPADLLSVRRLAWGVTEARETIIRLRAENERLREWVKAERETAQGKAADMFGVNHIGSAYQDGKARGLLLVLEQLDEPEP